MVALAAAVAADVEGFLVGQRQLATPAEEAGVLAGEFYLNGGFKVGTDIGDGFFKEIVAAPVNGRFRVRADRDIESRDCVEGQGGAVRAEALRGGEEAEAHGGDRHGSVEGEERGADRFGTGGVIGRGIAIN